MLPSQKGYRMEDSGFRIQDLRSKIKGIGVSKLIAGFLITAALVLSSPLNPQSSVLAPTACASCNPDICCNCQNAWVDSDNDGYTVGGPVSVCFNPGAPSGYRTQPSAQPDCNDSDPSVGPAPANYGQNCSSCNACGVCNAGTIGCKGTCAATTPALPSNYGQSCSACNACGSCNYGTYGCNGCSVTAPAMNTYYRDADGDGYGNPNAPIQACSQPAGYVTNNTDCYDSNANAHPGQTGWFSTNRGDGSYDYNCDGTQTPQYPLGPCDIYSVGSLYQTARRSYGVYYCVNGSSYYTGNPTSGSQCGLYASQAGGAWWSSWGNPGPTCAGPVWCQGVSQILPCH